MALDATIGGVSANSYIDEADAELYFANVINSDAWDAATAPNRKAALITASRLLDQNVNYFGFIAADTQALRWPRTSAFTQDGVEYSDAIIPEKLKNIVCDLALTILDNGGYTGATNQFKQLNIGSLLFKYKEPGGDGPFPPAVLEAIKLFGEYIGASTGRQVSTARLQRT